MVQLLVWPNPVGIYNSYEHGPKTVLRSTADSIPWLSRNFADYCATLTEITRNARPSMRCEKKWIRPSGLRTIWRSHRFCLDLSWNIWRSRTAQKAVVLLSKSLSEMILVPHGS